jgi:hypothetical protein
VFCKYLPVREKPSYFVLVLKRQLLTILLLRG